MGLLLADEEAARQFCRTYLLPYDRPRLLQCTGRNKYADGKLSMGTLILERTILRLESANAQACEDKFIKELRKFELLAAAGWYTDPKNKVKDLKVKEEWMVVYTTAFPLDEDDASDAFVAKVIEMRNDQRRALHKAVEADVDNKKKKHAPKMTNILSKIVSALHSSPCKQYRYLKLDVDTKDPTLIEQLQGSLKGGKVMIAVETRGGYHVVLEKGPFCRTLYELERQVNDGVPKEDQWITIENGQGPMLAIPGTNQGGFTVRLATEEWILGVEGKT